MQPQIVEHDGQRFVKVRVPVMVDSDGRWFASADSSQKRDAAMAGVEYKEFDSRRTQ